MCKRAADFDKQVIPFSLFLFHFFFSPFAGFNLRLGLLYAFVPHMANRTKKEKEAKFPNANTLLGPKPQLTNF